MEDKKYIVEGGKKYIKYSFLCKNKFSNRGGKNDGSFVQTDTSKWEFNHKVIDRDVIYYIDYDNKNEYFIIPKSYSFDFGTIPICLLCFVGYRTKYVSYLLHDRLFDQDCILYVKSNIRISDKMKKLQKYGFGYKIVYDNEKYKFLYNRKFADKLLFHSINEESKEFYGTSLYIQHYLIYLAVRLFGFLYFKRVKNE